MGDVCLIVAPHPDDETIGAGIWIARRSHCAITILHTTDGSPRDLTNARAAGFQTRRAYGAARRRELAAALALVGGSRIRLRRLNYVDKESYLHLPELVARTAAVIDELRPSIVLSPAYEGGHPDHDAAAFAVAIARMRVAASFRHVEFPLYHAGPDGGMITGRFLPSENPEEVCILTPAEQATKRAMLRSFTTQQEILSHFGVEKEMLRDAPDYDFGRPPHAGRLLYEEWNFGVSGEDWRRRACDV
jgi:LmbE family N-acetylglucosaminyl deacetylase